MKNSIGLFLGLSLLISLFTACEKEQENALILDGDFVIKGLVSDELGRPMENIEVKLREPNNLEPGDDFYLISSSIARVVTDSDGRYSISIPKRKLDSLEKRDYKIPFTVDFSYYNTPKFNKFVGQSDRLAPFDLSDDELIFDKELPGGAFLTVVLVDNPEITASRIEGTIKQGSHLYPVNWTDSDSQNTLVDRLRINEDLDLELKWELTGNGISDEIIEAVYQLEMGEELVYEFEY